MKNLDVAHTVSLIVIAASVATAPTRALSATAQTNPPIAAFVQPDAITHKPPLGAFTLKRDGKLVKSEVLLQPCDRVEFLKTQSLSKKIRITTTRGGKNIVLNANSPDVEISCEKVPVSELVARTWMAISGGNRMSESRAATPKMLAAATRGGNDLELAVPVFSAARSNLAAGKRALVVPWVGGTAPYQVTLVRLSEAGNAAEVLADIRVASGNVAELPMLDLNPGRYSIGVFHSLEAGEKRGWEEHNLYVVDATALPAMPKRLKEAKLSPADRALLFAYYLEGLGDGAWVFEAVQRVISKTSSSEATEVWLDSYRTRSLLPTQLSNTIPISALLTDGELAKRYADESDFVKALPLYKKILDTYETKTAKGTADDQQQLTLHIVDLATALVRTARYAEAEPLFLRALSRTESALGADHSDTGARLNNLAELYIYMGDYAKAEPLAQRALLIAQTTNGLTDPSIGSYLSNLAETYANMGQYARAEPLLVRSLAISEAVNGSEHPDTADRLVYLGGLYLEMGLYSRAEPLMRRALGIAEKVLSSDHPDFVAPLSVLAGLLQQMGKFSEAEPMFLRALAIAERSGGPDHPRTARSSKNLANFYMTTGQYSNAQALYIRALQIAEKVYSPDRAAIGGYHVNLAVWYHTMGQYASAELHLQRGLFIIEKDCGPDHPLTGDALGKLGSLLESMGRYREAEQLLMRSLGISEKTKGQEHPVTGTSLSLLAHLYQSMGLYAKAEPLHRRALTISERVLGIDHPKTGIHLTKLANLYEAMGRYAEAEQGYMRALGIAEKAQGPDHPVTASCLDGLAVLYHLMGLYPKVEPLFLRAIAISDKVNGEEHPTTGNYLNNLADYYHTVDQFGKAEALLLRALAIAEKTQGLDHPDTGARLHELGSLYSHLGPYVKAEPLYLRALAIAEKALGTEHPVTAKYLNSLAILYQRMGLYLKAEPLFLRSLEINEKALGLVHPDTGASLKNLSTLYKSMGRYALAEPIMLRAIAIAKKAQGPEHPRTGNYINSLAMLYEEMGQYSKAEPLMMRALDIAEKTEGPERANTGNRLNALASLYSAMGQYAKAESLRTRALAISEKALGPEHPDTGDRLYGLAEFYMAVGQYDRAEPFYFRALAISEKIKGVEHPDTGSLISDLAAMYGVTGRFAKGESLQLRALAIAEKTREPDHHEIAKCLNHLAGLYYFLNQYEKAEPLYVRALTIIEKAFGPEHPVTSGVVKNLAVTYKKLGRYSQAEPLYLRALAIATRTPDTPVQRFEAARGYAEFLRERGRNDPAIFFGKLAVNTFQSVREAAKGLATESQKSLFETNQKIYQDLSDWLIEAGRLAEAEQVLSMLKQQELQELTRRSGSVAQQVTMTGSELVSAQRFEALSGDGVKAATALESLNTREKQGGVLSAAEVSERDRLRAVLATQRDSMQVFLSGLQASLSQDAASAKVGRDGLERGTRQMQTLLRKAGPGHVGLHYVVTDERLSIIVTLAESSFARQIPVARATLNRQIAALRQVLKRPSIDPQPAAQALYASLIAPVQQEIKAAGAHTLVLSLTDLLRYVPFAALNDGQQYLIERYALTLYTPAGGQGISATNTGQWQIAGLGVTQAVTMKEDGDRAFSALPAVRAELDGIVRSAASPAGLVPGSISLDPQFTRLRFEQSLPRFPVLHVASHFQFTPGSEYLSYLVLGDGSRLTLADLKEMDFNGVQLLTLSACDTASGGGRNERGSEVEGLGAAVQLAGAKAVLASLWQVSDTSTAQLMRRFYELRTRDNALTTAQALQAAQLDMLRGQGPGTRADAKAATERAAVASVSAETSAATGAAASKLFSTPFTPSPNQPFAHPYFWAPFILMGNWL